MKKLFIHIPKNGGMTIRDSEIFQDKIEPVNKKWIQDYKGFRNTMKQYGERDTKGVEHARWIDVDPNVTNRYTAFAIVRSSDGLFIFSNGVYLSSPTAKRSG